MIKNDNSKCIHYAVTVPLDQEQIKNITKNFRTLDFTSKYNWERITYKSEKVDLRNSEKNNLTIALKILYAEIKKTYPDYFSKQNSKQMKRETNGVILQ